MANIFDAYPSDFLKSGDLQGRTVRVQIDRVQFDEVGRDKERKPVLYFVGKTKGMVLNRTNATTIANAYGQDYDTWNGCDLELYTAIVEFGGKQTEGLRVRIPPRQQQRPPQPAARPPVHDDAEAPPF